MHQHFTTERTDLVLWNINFFLACLKKYLGIVQILYSFFSCPQYALPDIVHTLGQRYVHQSMGKNIWMASSYFILTSNHKHTVGVFDRGTRLPVLCQQTTPHTLSYTHHTHTFPQPLSL